MLINLVLCKKFFFKKKVSLSLFTCLLYDFLKMLNWKHSFERLSKHKYVAYIIHPKKVVCICGKKITLNRKWEEDYLDRHARHSGCKADEGQRTIYNWFKPKEVESIEIEEEEEYDSDIYDNMDDDDLIQIDELIDKNQIQELPALETSDV